MARGCPQERANTQQDNELNSEERLSLDVTVGTLNPAVPEDRSFPGLAGYTKFHVFVGLCLG